MQKQVMTIKRNAPENNLGTKRIILKQEKQSHSSIKGSPIKVQGESQYSARGTVPVQYKGNSPSTVQGKQSQYSTRGTVPVQYKGNSPSTVQGEQSH